MATKKRLNKKHQAKEKASTSDSTVDQHQGDDLVNFDSRGVIDSAGSASIDPCANVLAMLKQVHGTDFQQYKDTTIYRRIERRAQMRGVTNIDEYSDILAVDKHELLELYADLLIEVTEFFRDQEAFEVLEKDIIPQLINQQKNVGSLRVWVPGCASGEEAYSIAILLQEYVRHSGISLQLKIIATDIHVRSMNQASSGIYNEAALKNVSVELVKRYFDCTDGLAQIKPQLRNMVIFSNHDLTRDPPFTRIDLVSCRNILIYLKEDTQEKVMNILHFSLRKKGYLFLGPCEQIGKISHEFETVNGKWRIYRKKRDIRLFNADSIPRPVDFTGNGSVVDTDSLRVSGKSDRVSSADSIPFKRAHRRALESIVERHAPPGFLLDEHGVIVHIFGNAGEFIPLQAGTFSRRVVDLIQPELKTLVKIALDYAHNRNFAEFKRSTLVQVEGGVPVTYVVSLSKVEITGEESRYQLLTVEKEEKTDVKDNLSSQISLTEIAAFDSSEILCQRISSLEHSLISSEQKLQWTIEELEASNEELQGTNEELMATREELQCTDEELHSANEELYTGNVTRRSESDNIVNLVTDIDEQLQASLIGTMHLDEALRISRYNSKARSVFNILPQDLGRAFSTITIRAADVNILALVERVNQEHVTHEKRIQIESKIFLLRIIPYRAQAGHPYGVLIVIIDVTDFESIRSEVPDLNVHYTNTMDYADTTLVRWDAQTGQVYYCNEPYARRWGKTADEVIGENLFELKHEEDHETLNRSVKDFEADELRNELHTYTDYHGSVRVANTYTRAISRDGVNIHEFQENAQDCTEEVNYRKALEKLFSVFSDDKLDFNKKINYLLKVGCDHFQLDSAILGMITGGTFEVKNAIGKVSKKAKHGRKLQLKDTFSGNYFDKQASLAIDSISGSHLAQAARNFEINAESYIGAIVNNATGPYGTVSFFSTKSRGKSYDLREQSFVVLLSSWIGFMVENQENTEFIENQIEYYKSLFRNVPVMLFLCDKDGLIISASDRLCERLELEPHTLPGKNCLKVLNIAETTELKAAVTDGNVSRLPLTMITPNDATFELELNSCIKPIGTLQGVRVVVLINVSDRNHALRDSEGQNRRLEAANEGLNQFAFIASHDLQEPLRKIQQFSSFLEEDLEGLLTDDSRFHLDTIVDASARMSTLIYDLLSYAGTSRDEPRMEAVSLSRLMEEVLDELALPIQESAADIQIGELPEIEGDKVLVRQLLTNLMSNSIKYRSQDRDLKITLNSFGEDNTGGVKLTDNGIGFEMKFAQKIFEPFNRLHGADEYKGNGIGLAICSTVCDKHNWHLSVASEVEVGSVFTIKFNQR